MNSRKSAVRRISRRFLLGVALTALVASAHQAHSTSPPFFFVDPRLLVVNYQFQAADPELRSFVSSGEVFPSLVSYIESEFARHGIDIPIVLRQHFADLPTGVVEDAVLYATIRIDMSKIPAGEIGEEVAVGAVSLMYSRSATTSWSQVPYELFAVPLRDELVRSTLIAAAKRHLGKSLIDPIAGLYKK